MKYQIAVIFIMKKTPREVFLVFIFLMHKFSGFIFLKTLRRKNKKKRDEASAYLVIENGVESIRYTVNIYSALPLKYDLKFLL